MSNWYYVNKGNREGPLDLQTMSRLIEQKKITLQTLVWPGEGEWMVAGESTLSALFISDEPQESAVPPIPANLVDNRFVWGVVAVPFIGGLVEYLVGHDLIWLYVLLNIGLCVLDERRLKAAGHPAPESFWTVLIPVYLWKRADLLKHKKHYFWGWIAASILASVLAWGTAEADIEDASCKLVTDIIHNQLHESAVCKAVHIDDKVSDDFYRATATLDNGNDLDITVEKRPNNQIYVSIPQQ